MKFCAYRFKKIREGDDENYLIEYKRKNCNKDIV